MKKINKNSIVTALTVASLAIILAGPMVALAAGPASVNLGSASNFVILTKTGISTTGPTSIVGDIGVSPAAASYITGFGLSLPTYGTFSTSSLVSGKVYASDYTAPTPANLTAAVMDMQTAYTDAAGRTNPTATELGAGNIGGLTIAPGLYKWSTGVTIPTNVTLSGGVNDVWIFQVAQNLNVSSGVNVVLAGGAQASNIFWVVAGQTTLGTTSVFNGNILDQTAIVLNTGATLNGRTLAQTAVTLDSNSVTVSSVSVSVIPATPATPAMPATSAIPMVSPAVPATPAIPSSGSSMGETNRQALITQITTQIQSIQAQINAQGGATPNANANARFNRDLTVGVSGEDVRLLQAWLNAHGYIVASSGAGSSGNETTTFGGLTRAALSRFQAQVGISPAAGYFGARTRVYLATH